MLFNMENTVIYFQFYLETCIWESDIYFFIKFVFEDGNELFIKSLLCL